LLQVSVHWVIEEMVGEGEKVFSRFTWRGTHHGEFFGVPGTGRQITVKGVWNVLCSIARHKPTRVNVFTHATEGYIGLSGKVVKGNVILTLLERKTH